jgi:hypothetical protein
MNLIRNVLLLLALGLVPKSVWSQPGIVSFHEEKPKSIIFDHGKPTEYEIGRYEIKAEVANSSSALFLPFKEITTIQHFCFLWRESGKLNISPGQALSSKEVDDAYVRLGFLISGAPSFLPFFAPTWIKNLTRLTSLSSDRMLSFLASIELSKTLVWPSPYSKSITNQIIPWQTRKDGWKYFFHKFERSQSVIGLWIQSDGDNTVSNFTAWIRDINLNQCGNR